MSDRPTLWVSDPNMVERIFDGTYPLPEIEQFRKASRADLLAALGAHWECSLIPQMVARTGADFDPEWEGCGPNEPHEFCHWAVKP